MSLLVLFGILMVVFGLTTIFLKNKNKNAVLWKALTTFCAVLIAVFNSEGFEWVITVGLIFDVFGDVFLEFTKTFILGMLSFLTGHVLYSIGFAMKFGIPSWSLYFCLHCTWELFHSTIFDITFHDALKYSFSQINYLSQNLFSNIWL